MSQSFQAKLARLYNQHMEKYGTSKQISDYKKMISYGALGEMGEEYYLFIYRDLFRNSAYYGAVIFINKADSMGNPVTVFCIEQDGVEQLRNIYIRAALFFLKNEFQNTMNVGGTIREVFNFAREKIDSVIQVEVSPAARKELESYNYDVGNQEITYKEIEPTQSGRVFVNRALREQLELLEQPPTHSGAAPRENGNKQRALLALNIKVENIGLTDKKEINFQPIVVPFKRNSDETILPRRLPPEEVEKYRFEGISLELLQFFKYYTCFQRPEFTDAQRTRIMNRLFFPQLAEGLFTLPEDLRYCQSPDLRKGIHPVQAVVFNKVNIRFAPSFDKNTIFTVRLSFQLTGDGGDVLDASEDYVIKYMDDDGFYIFFTTPGGENYFARPEEAPRFASLFRFLNQGIYFYLHDFDKILEALEELESPYIAIQSGLLKKYRLSLRPAPVLRLYPHDNRAGHPEHLEVEFDYLREIRKFLRNNPEKEVFTYEPDTAFEGQCLKLLKTDPTLQQHIEYDDTEKRVAYHFRFKQGNHLDWLIEMGTFYMEKGFRIYSAKWKRFVSNTSSRIKVQIEETVDWLEFKPTVHTSDEDAGNAIDTIDLETRMVTDKKGQLHLLTKEDIEKLAKLEQYGDPLHGTFRIPSRNHVLIRKLYDRRMADIPALKPILAAQEKLEKFEKIEDYPVTAGFNGQLRHYQQEGFKWLRFLGEYGFSGCLADDMGLGKTVQTLALLQSLKDKKQLKTCLLVAPVSAVPNWEDEIKKFTKGFRVLRHLGANRSRENGDWEKQHIIITSYATMRNDIGIFSQFDFHYVILDESQAIKNPTSLVSKAVKVLNARHRLALSGTPIENNTMELWSLFDFLLPGYLGSQQYFNRQFATPLERDKDTDRAALLKQMIYPFILRRKKEEVELELPEKTEIVSRLGMEEEQLKLYSETARKYRESLEKEIDENGVSGSSIKILEAMLRLRQMCLFPGLVDEKYKPVPSAKFEHFLGLMEDILAEDHKVLVFSQFVEVLNIIRDHFDNQEIPYSYIDGSVKVQKRKEAIDAFQQDPDRRVFLLSLKAGGVAINLTAADYVIIFDPWWNPAVEAQAIDRSHRIGQTRKVLVYRMVVQDSIEEKMLEMQEEKKELVENLIVSDSSAFKNLDKKDILKLFR